MKTDFCHISDKPYCQNSTNQELIYESETKKIKSKMDPGKCLDV